MPSAVTSYAAANDQPNGGAAMFRTISLLATGQIVKASPGRLFGWHLFNNNAAKLYVKVYDKATAATSADTPKLTIEIAAGSSDRYEIASGLRFDAGISVRACTGVADADNTAPSANDVVANLFYA